MLSREYDQRKYAPDLQSEINMLIKVAEKFNFTINTFTHILEGYKVAAYQIF